MKRIFTGALLLFSFLILFCRIANCADDNQKTQSSSQKTQQTLSRPILPPVVPSPLPGVSPTPSPNIAMPPIAPATMDVQRINELNANNQLVNTSALPNFPRLSTLPVSTSVAASVPSAPISQQKMQLIRNLFGTIIDIGLEKDEAVWLDVKDVFSGETMRINVDSKNTRVTKKDVTLILNDLKIGDIVRVVSNQTGNDSKANVISIITEEDLNANTHPK